MVSTAWARHSGQVTVLVSSIEKMYAKVASLPSSLTDYSVPVMKALVATVMLLVQLQPLFGSVACLGFFDRQSRPECEMPDQAQPPVNSVIHQGGTSHSCQLSAICMPAPLAIPMVPVVLESAALPPHGVVATSLLLPHGISLSPPARPPSA